MMTPAPIRSAIHAAFYFERSEHADYYTRDESCPSMWIGKGAETLGVAGQVVESERFKRYLDGDIAGQKIGTVRNGKHQHKPGYDLQLSPDKTTTIAALVGRDGRITVAQDETMEQVIAFVEKKAAYTRVHTRNQKGKSKIEQVATDNLICAAFRHDTSRSLDPQLHTHAVVMNATFLENGELRSIEGRNLYASQKEIGLYYRQVLAAKLKGRGYELERAADGNFRIKGIPQTVVDAFSQRRDIIDQELEKLGYTRENAPAKLKEKISHKTREKKVHIDSELLQQQWRQKAAELGFDIDSLVQSAIERSNNKELMQKEFANQYDKLQQIIDKTIASLSERESVFSKRKLIHEINLQAVGFGISPEQVEKSVAQAEQDGRLVAGREVKEYSTQFKNWEKVSAYTTKKNIQIEEQMIDVMLNSQGIVAVEFSKVKVEEIILSAEKESIEKGFDGWTKDQKEVAKGILASKDQFLAVQGYAGTAKTSTVLRAVASEYQQLGYQVIGMAPSASACQSLRDGADIEEVVTVASHMLNREASKQKQLWLLDEASLLSTKDMKSLLLKVKAEQARIVLVGDTKQLGSVEAGAAFRQLQENGIQTFDLKEIVRQENEHVLESVYHSIDGEAKLALEKINNGGGVIIENAKDSASRFKQITEKYQSLSSEQRKQTLVIEPSREGRDELTRQLRKSLINNNELSKQNIKAARLDRVDLTKAEMKDVIHYQAGDTVRFGRAYKSKNIAKGSYWRIGSIDKDKNVIHLKSDNDQQLIWNPNSWGAKAQAFRSQESELRVGDQIYWTLNDKKLGLTNGSKGTVRGVDVENNIAQVEFANNKTIGLDLSQESNKHWNYDYVSTAHAAQGKTADLVLYHAESFRKNLSSQKALYVSISRAKEEVMIYTDNEEKLIQQILEHSGEKQYALEKQVENQIEFDMDF